MYFSVKYIDLNTFLITKDVDLKVESDDFDQISFSAKNKELIVNPDCFLGIVLNYIFEEIGIKENMRAQFDIMTDTGQLLNVHCYPPDISATGIFDNRGVYFIAYCEDGEAKPMIAKRSKEFSNYTQHRRGSLKKTRSRSSRTSNSQELPTLGNFSNRSIKNEIKTNKLKSNNRL